MAVALAQVSEAANVAARTLPHANTKDRARGKVAVKVAARDASAKHE